jgi:hypothetical protein
VLQYLGRYTHRVAISNHRLVSFAEGMVTFRWRDSAHNNEQKLTLPLDEFLRRFLLRSRAPQRFRAHSELWISRQPQATLLPLCFHLLGSAQQPNKYYRPTMMRTICDSAQNVVGR